MSEVRASAESDLSAADQFLMAQLVSKLPPRVANAVRASLAAAPGPRSQHAIIQLFAAPKMIELAKSSDESSCIVVGADAVIRIAEWAGASDAADGEQATALDEMRARLAKVDVTDIDGALDVLTCTDAAEGVCNARLFDAADSCDGGYGDDDDATTSSTTYSTTTYTLHDPSPADHDRAAAAESKLASIFQELDAVEASRGMQTEWELLRARYRKGLSRAARESIQIARRDGSATLARDGVAALRFDDASRMVDAFVRSRIAFDVDAMNLVHAAVASEHQGRIRTAGQEAFHGRRAANRPYLPGAAVERATANAFAAVRERRANGAPTPLVAAMFDQRIISIHPYMDANGRTTRLMTDWLLARDGFPPALATTDTSTIALWQNGRVARDAHLEHITEGMRRTVALVEAVG